MNIVSGKQILDEGTRVWVWDPLFLGEKPIAGKIIGFTINFPRYLELTGETHETQYYVDFGDKQSWIASYQITGYLALVK